MSDDADAVQARITAFWNVLASGYNTADNVAAPGSSEYTAWLETVRSLLPETPSDVLDVGTGTGFVAQMAAELGHRVTGVDLAEGMLESAQDRIERAGLDVSLLVGDAVRPPFPPASFDVVISRSVIWTLRELETAFRSWQTLLRPGGRVVAIYGLGTGPMDESPAQESAEKPMGLFQRHYTAETRNALSAMRLQDHSLPIRMAQRAGLVDVTVSSLELVRGWETSPGSDLPHALVGHRLIS
ncbi:class I SAM-dependent methyltransferase [Actinopolymorpha sp. B9G3]|uniref:class I SAM-dependent methyltransferase n=1 Tax=Actinopolymorpha sp. B9G3 TaxID=3158970 RepID=UPI0032D94EF7